MIIVEANGASIPALGLGTWELRGDGARRMVEEALGIGYRHIDTAQAYGNEREVGEAMRNSGLPRDQLFITTKIWPDRHRRDELRDAARESLELLGLDCVDLLLLHWPNSEVPLGETIEALNEVRAAGETRHIGVSNFTVRLIEQAVGLSAAPLVNNQVEYHPFLDQERVLDCCRENGLSLTAYMPLARGRATTHPLLETIAKRYDKTAAQVTLRWLVQQQGVIAIPRTSNTRRLRQNMDIFDFALNDHEMGEVSSLAEPHGRMIDAFAWAPDWDR